MKKIIIGILSLLTAILIFALYHKNKNSIGPNNTNFSKITFIEPRGGDFKIPSITGEFSTQENRGKVIFLFFGFTHCPHICPTTLANLYSMIKDLPKDYQKKAQVLFISIDPDRDTLKVLKQKFEKYSSTFIAATDTKENLRKITSLFGARFSKFKTKENDTIVDHTSHVFVINERGEWVDSLEFNVPPEEFRHAFETAHDKVPNNDKMYFLSEVSEAATNLSCNVGLGKCFTQVDGKNIEMQFSPQPIKQGRKINIEVKTDSSLWKPLLVDLKGIDLDMGYIRPRLEENKENKTFNTSFELPLCEIQNMRWHVRLIMKNQKGDLIASTYFLTTMR